MLVCVLKQRRGTCIIPNIIGFLLFLSYRDGVRKMCVFFFLVGWFFIFKRQETSAFQKANASSQFLFLWQL